ncbi:hypothetical protein J6590_000060 [Homalodisca vitripennis]|nr:hypothetical protein J6590_000060 [Homalodisca vitripennis]
MLNASPPCHATRILQGSGKAFRGDRSAIALSGQTKVEGRLTSGWFVPSSGMCSGFAKISVLYLGNPMEVQDRHITNSKSQHIRVKDGIDRCTLMRRMTVGVARKLKDGMTEKNCTCYPLSCDLDMMGPRPKLVYLEYPFFRKHVQRGEGSGRIMQMRSGSRWTQLLLSSDNSRDVALLAHVWVDTEIYNFNVHEHFLSGTRFNFNVSLKKHALIQTFK